MARGVKSADISNRGQLHPRAKLTDHEVELLRQMHESGTSQKLLVAIFEISKSQVSKIIHYKQR